MKRQDDFYEHYGLVKARLTFYIDEKEREQSKWSWQKQATTFRDETLKTISQNGQYSLYELRNSIETFCSTLVDLPQKGIKFLLSPIYGEDVGKDLGPYVGATGSTLQQTLLYLAEKIEPFKAEYTLDEIKTAKETGKLQEGQIFKSFVITPATDYEFLSQEGKRILGMIAADETLSQQFLEQAKSLGYDIDAGELVEQGRVVKKRAGVS